MAKKRILIVYTGGTIGMTHSPQGYVPVQGFDELLAKRLQGRTLTPLPQYDLIELPCLIDSANLHPDNWTTIAETIITHRDAYDGFVVLHGTDTMAYSASALSFMLLGLQKPVILTGAQIPLIELRNDAFANVVTSLILATSEKIKEVCLYFNGRLLRGNRARKLKSSGFDAFDSPNFHWLGSIGINMDLREDLLLKPQAQETFHRAAFKQGAVSILQVYPGMDAHMFDAMLKSNTLRAMILMSYGVGNPPDQNKGLINFLKQARDQNVVVANISQCIQGTVSQGAYATGATLNDIGVIAGGDLTLEAAFCKLHVLISAEKCADDIRTQFLTPVCGECCENAGAR